MRHKIYRLRTSYVGFYVEEYEYLTRTQASNWVLKKFKPNRWLPFIVGAWGVVTTLSGLVQNFGGLIIIRIMLGFCEGGLLPGIVSES